MLARSSRNLLLKGVSASMLSRSAARLALPRLVAPVRSARTFASCTAIRNSAENTTFRSDGEGSNGGKYVHSQRLDYLLSDTKGPNQKALIKQLSDDEVVHLTIVINTRNRWKPAHPDFTLPRYDREDTGEDARASLKCAEYLYNVFSFPTLQHLQRFNKEVAEFAATKAKLVNAVMLFDARSRTLTVGLPSYVGIEVPYPASENEDKLKALFAEYRAQGTSDEQKRDIAKQLRSYIVANGFKKSCHIFNLFLRALSETVQKATLEEVIRKKTSFSEEVIPGPRNAKFEESVPADVRTKATGNVARKASDPLQKERKKGGKAAKGPAKAPAAKKAEPNLADRLRADDPKLPEAGTFVAEDGDAHKPSKGVDALEEHMPFPKPTAEEMGINKPIETSADNPKLPEAGTFVAQDGDAHKPSKGVDALQEHVPFPTPTAEEMGIKKPAETSADDPKLPEAGTFVAQDGGAHKPSTGVDALEEHVPFPKPTAEEMGIKKPTET
ncbi:conserved hypothetical protein [Sporisorium reilianum SRZ2]|uniref:Uncharacterized protein n=1 Tax=Sporisorium reilianum (strain SRZ2) TaxID=999809 RepID=E6ZUJ1_SPORE|nr:conserved hypothetical protein [Sporisorium reilianum SRZ2]